MLPKLLDEEQAASASAQAAAALRRAPSENAVKWPRSPIPSPTRADRPPRRPNLTAPGESGAADPSLMSAKIMPFLGRPQQATRDVVNARYPIGRSRLRESADQAGGALRVAVEAS